MIRIKKSRTNLDFIRIARTRRWVINRVESNQHITLDFDNVDKNKQLYATVRNKEFRNSLKQKANKKPPPLDERSGFDLNWMDEIE